MSAKVHVHLHVSDLAKSRTFYEKFFGVAPVKAKRGYLKFLPPLGPVNLSLSEGRPGARAQSSVDHLGIQVESPAVVTAELARVRAAGLPVREELGVNCCHANQDKFWVEDPDGVEWEVYHLNYDLEDEVRPAGFPLVDATTGGGATPEVKTRVRERYARAATEAAAGAGACCNPITSDLYRLDETVDLPGEALQASLGCGNPVALAELRPGEVVLDLGSGGGLDVLLSARRVGPTGKAYGLDMTDEMLALARENQAKSDVENAEFLKGEIEAIPLPDASVDVVISNCVINLSADKRRVLAEAFRVLRPGGRFAVSDIVVAGPVPEAIRRSMDAWTGCVAGALEEDEYRRLLAAVGFEAIDLEPTRIYRAADARAFLESCVELPAGGSGLDDVLAEVDGKYRSAFVRAVKPGRPAR